MTRQNTDQSESLGGETSFPLEKMDFSLVLGGPLFQLLHRSRLTDDTLNLVKRRIVVISLLAWLPLLLLSAVEGHLLPGSAPVPFLKDVEVHIRYLLAVPLVIAAELIVHQRMRVILGQFVVRRLIPDSALAQFDAAIAAAMKLRNSVYAEVAIIAVVYGVGALIIWPQFLELNTATWYATPSEDGARLTIAGYWYAYLSIPIFQFLLLRWYFRIFIWARFLWRVSRIDLNLVPAHPDNTGGLGFLSDTVVAFIPVLLAHGVLLSGHLANRIFYLGERLVDFKAPVALMLVFLLCLVAGPLLVFMPQLFRTQWTGLHQYGALGQRYVREFEAKWLHGGAPPDEPLVGSSDIQSLSDLAGCYSTVRGMKLVPISRNALLQIIAAVLVPILPLMLTMMPLDELLKQLLGILA